MRYLGGKFQLVKQLCPFLDSKLEEGQPFVDLFAGSCNIVANITKTKNRYANDINEDIMVTMRAASAGFEFPSEVSLDEWLYMRENGDPKDPLCGFIAYGCSFMGKRWGGYAPNVPKCRVYPAKASSNALKRKGVLLNGVKFSVGSYQDFKIPKNALVYCDIPYSNTAKYGGQASGFNHDEFYQWVTQQTCDIYISEYATGYNPLNLKVVWQKESLRGLKNREGLRPKTSEVLFHKPAT